MSPIVFYFCGSLLPVFMSKATCKVIFNYRALLLNEPLLMQASVSDIKDKETAPVAEHKWESALPSSVTWNNCIIHSLLNLEIRVIYYYCLLN